MAKITVLSGELFAGKELSSLSSLQSHNEDRVRTVPPFQFSIDARNDGGHSVNEDDCLHGEEDMHTNFHDSSIHEQLQNERGVPEGISGSSS
jgi:hypothetical protein